jgi:Peptidase family M23
MQLFRTIPFTGVFSRSSFRRFLSLASLSIVGLQPAFAVAENATLNETLQPAGTANSGDTKSSITSSEWTPLVLWTATKPNPFEGSDNKYHLAYDVVLTNFNSEPGVLKQIDVINPSTNKLLYSLSGKELEAHITKYNEKSLHFAPCECAIGWMNLAFEHKADIPPRIIHRVVFETFDQESKSRIQDDKAEVPVELMEPVVISPPVKGDKWVAIGGYNGSQGHRRALLALSNHLFAAQTYAIDWVKLDKDNNLKTGDLTKNESNSSFGLPVLAVVDATVAGVIDRFDDQTPDKATGTDRLQFPTGNTVILDLGHGYYATYAHLKRGSIKVKEGDHVTRGQVLALIGNSGNSTGAHLHFHVTRGVGPLNSPGIPYVIDNFELTDEIQDIEKFMETPESPKSLPLKPSDYKGKHVLQLPRQGSVVKFAE